ncbi:multidrug efflux SMR transporter [Polycladomyces sp. WAk]|uniref:Multidrug efflux SMR transporter n=1 Tax=Polycladomyces zharkentensis TaxID=2807616 RepID=A0ABS2WMX6_9BACL|nr:multidrug efflux SMR transporter [Polycladomyces sp. WAk]MBN2910927.1 multidrug efflux SMR transporter [Polycladomyces sp. WAk]
MKGYIALGIAIAGEITGTSMLKLSAGFSNFLPSIGFILGFGVAFYFVSISLRYIPLGTAYAIWSGAGTVLTALIDILIWKEPFNIVTVLGIVLIVGGVVILNATKSPDNAVVKDKTT